MEVQLDDTEQRKFAAALANPDKKIRERTCKTLQSYVKKNSFDSLELLRLWKALYYCLWLTDKQEVQLELAAFLSGLLHHCKDDEAMLDFFVAFWNTVMREWGTLDQYRVNKFYSLMRLMLHEAFVILEDRAWPDELSIAMVDIIDQQVIQSRPNGPRYHLGDIMLEELHKVTNGQCAHEVVELVLSPFYHIIATDGDAVLRSRVSTAVFETYLTTHANELANVKGKAKKAKVDSKTLKGVVDEKEGDEARVFPWVSTQLLQKTFFDLASSTEHKLGQDNRKQLYALHAAFQAATGVPFVEGDGDLEELELEHEKSSRERSSQGTGKGKSKKLGKGKDKDKVASPINALTVEHDTPKVSTRGGVRATRSTLEGTTEGKNSVEEGEKKNKKKKKKREEQEEEEEEKEKEGATGEEEPPVFIKSKKFKGRKPGYVFKNDGRGNIGYYLDAGSPSSSPTGSKSSSGTAAVASGEGKRKGKKKARTSESDDDELSAKWNAKKARVSFGKNQSKAYKDSVKALKASDPSPTKLRRSTRGVLKL